MTSLTADSAVRAIVLDGTCGLPSHDLGGKAWGINRMRALGLPVPPAFVLPTSVCRAFLNGGGLPEGTSEALREGLRALERATGRRFGDPDRALLVSVRSGAPMSMPGMMDTLLNLGIDDGVEAGMSSQSGDAAWVKHLRLRFDEQYRNLVEGKDPASTPWLQLEHAVEAVFRSWNSPRAIAYRAHHGLDDSSGTAVTVQAMVFGNLDEDSGTGVLFTRNPLNGDPSVYGEWLSRAQGEDVVSGVRTPTPLRVLASSHPQLHTELLAHAELLEQQQRDVQDIEFTVEQNRLWILQTRTAKRAPRAAVRTAVDLANEGLITAAEALARVTPEQVHALLTPGLNDQLRAAATLLARGEPACPGIASGIVVTDPDDAVDACEDGPVVLVRQSTSPEDVHGMLVSAAVVTEHGGATSHAALVSRELGLPCVVGCGDGTLQALSGRSVTVDGTTGEVFDGVLDSEPVDATKDPYLLELRGWAQTLGGADELLAALDTAADSTS